MTAQSVPLIGLPACVRDIGIHPFHVVGDKYMRAVVDAAGGLPVAVPALGGALDRDAVLERCDGLLFTGSPSNVEPAHYDGPPSADGTLHDAERDATTLPLIRNAIDAGIPILCICRGFQELNVALGGSLHQEVHNLPGRLDHRSDEDRPRDVQYGPIHEVTLTVGGCWRRSGPRQRSWSIRCMPRGSTGPRPGFRSRRSRPTARSRQCASAMPLHSRSASNGTRSGR